MLFAGSISSGQTSVRDQEDRCERRTGAAQSEGTEGEKGGRGVLFDCVNI